MRSRVSAALARWRCLERSQVLDGALLSGQVGERGLPPLLVLRGGLLLLAALAHHAVKRVLGCPLHGVWRHGWRCGPLPAAHFGPG